MQRWLTIIVSLGIFVCAPVSAKPSNFAGTWEVRWCGDNPNNECGGFYLYLIQKGNRICGDHFYATLNAGRINEGKPKSILGKVSGNTAMISITSGRDNSIYRAKIIRVGRNLDWRLLEMTKEGNGDEPLIAEKANLVRNEGKDASEDLRRVAIECNEF